MKLIPKFALGYKTLYFTESPETSDAEETRPGYPGSTYKYNKVFNIDAVANNGVRYYDAIKLRYDNFYKHLRNRGYTKELALHLAPILTTHSILESGYVLDNSAHNLGGINLGSKNPLKKYNSLDEFFTEHLDNLDYRWPNWKDSKSLEDFDWIINNRDLNITSQEDFVAYNRSHRDNPIYIYAPVWRNGDYRNRLISTRPRVDSYILMFDKNDYN